MKDIINNTTPIEAIAILAIFAVELLYSRKKPFAQRRKVLFAFGLTLILYTTLLRRISSAIGKPARTARLEFVGFNPSGCMLNVLLFVPLGLSLRRRSWWFPIVLSVTVETACFSTREIGKSSKIIKDR